MPTNRDLYYKAIKEFPEITSSEINLVLMHVNGFINYSDLIINFDKETNKGNVFYDILQLIKNGKSVQYVLKEVSFLDKLYYVDERVLIPREETEEMVSYAIEILKKECDFSPIIADIGTGSGCIAISLKCALTNSKIYATDISFDALDVARINAEKHKRDILFVHGNMLDPLIEKSIKIDVLISNPPYIDINEIVDENVVKNEPHIALFSNPSWKYYDEILSHCLDVLNRYYFIFFEIGNNQSDMITTLVNKYLPLAKIEIKKDMQGKDRFVIIRGKND